MKPILILLISGLTIAQAYAQQLKESEVPAAIKPAFIQKFPNAKTVTWEKEDTSSFEASFKVGKEKYSALFDTTGKWLETETEISKDKLPEAVRAALAKEFPGYKIEETVKVETPEQELQYEVEMEKKEISYDVRFSAGGQILKKEEIKESDEEKD